MRVTDFACLLCASRARPLYPVSFLPLRSVEPLRYGDRKRQAFACAAHVAASHDRLAFAFYARGGDA